MQPETPGLERTTDKSSGNKGHGQLKLSDFPVTFSVLIGHTTLSMKEWLNLGVGSRITLGERWQEPVTLLLNGQAVGKGRVVLVGNQFGIRVSQWGRGDWPR